MPVHTVTLSPFFLSKYELTQSQWLAATGSNPSTYDTKRYYPGWNANQQPWSGLHPVESVSWARAGAVLGWLGLCLPSNAQWEYAYRAHSTTIYPTGATKESLSGYANLADRFLQNPGARSNLEEWLDDGHVVHAPIGSFRANGFGIHDMPGNVTEWVEDSPSTAFYSRSPALDPVARDSTHVDRIVRGSDFKRLAVVARSAAYTDAPVESTQQQIGIRPVRVISP